MRCIASFALLAAACTDSAPYMAISDAPGPITASQNDQTEWSLGSGTSEFHAPGTLALPALVTLRIEGRSADGDVDVNDPLRDAAVAVVEGSACRLSTPLTCMGGICFVEVELTQTGLCLVRATGTTRDGVAVDTCWFRGTWEADSADPTFSTRMEEMTDHAFTDCVARER